jgi:hypothetical protein
VFALLDAEELQALVAHEIGHEYPTRAFFDDGPETRIRVYGLGSGARVGRR